MKKYAVSLFVVILLITCIFAPLMLSGCNAQVVDTTWSFERGIIFMPDGTTLYGDVESWKDFENSDMIQVKIDDKVYLTHSSNVVLISE